MPQPHPITGFSLTAHAALAAWPADRPLAVAWASGPTRWTILGRPRGSVTGWDAAMAAIRESGPASPSGPADDPPNADLPPFSGGWIGYLSYDAGCLLEPRAQAAHAPSPTPPSSARDDRRWPTAHLARIDDALILDRHTGLWWGIGEWREIVDGLSDKSQIPNPKSEIPFSLAPLATATPSSYISSVSRIIEYIRAGDIYQANLAHRLSAGFSGSCRTLFAALLRAADPWHGGYLEFLDPQNRARAIASASPELFLDFDPGTRSIITRPMKGTRPGAADPRELDAAEKDRAELAMIVDLMRNDLGRVADFGSVRVESPRSIERHGGDLGKPPNSQYCATALDSVHAGILQATATVSARLRNGLGVADLLAATFPGGSVTGAPKIRAMQIIDELEPVRRGPYCGAFGWISDSGAASLNIAIRTALLTGGPAGPTAAPASIMQGATLDYSVGAGIVADSDPKAEWDETLDKAAILAALPTTALWVGAE